MPPHAAPAPAPVHALKTIRAARALGVTCSFKAVRALQCPHACNATHWTREQCAGPSLLASMPSILPHLLPMLLMLSTAAPAAQGRTLKLPPLNPPAF